MVKTSAPFEVEKEAFLSRIQETEFNRGGTSGGGVPGLKPFIEGKVPEAFKNFYYSEE